MRLIALIGFALAFAVNLAFAFSTPERDGWVTDQAGILDADTASAIATKLVALQRDTGAEVAVVTLSSLQGASIETWGNVLGESWGVGRRSGDDTGVLLIVAPNDRKVRIAVGYGLGNRLSDSVAAMIIADHIVPYFKRGEFSRGVKAGVDSIVVQLGGGQAASSTDVERVAAYPVSTRSPSLWSRIRTLKPSRDTLVIGFWVFVVICLLILTMQIAGNAGYGSGGSRGYGGYADDDDDDWRSTSSSRRRRGGFWDNSSSGSSSGSSSSSSGSSWGGSSSSGSSSHSSGSFGGGASGSW